MRAATTKRAGRRAQHLKVPGLYAGYEVRDPLDEKVGTVECVFFNAAAEPEYIRTRMGPFGRKRVLLPVQLVAVDDERRALLLR